MDRTHYWNRRVSRRASLRGGAIAGAGLAGAALLGCGDDEDPNGTPGDPGTDATPTAEPVGDEGEATSRQGGTLTRFTSTMPTENFNQFINAGEGTSLSPHHVYDRPFIASLEDPGYRLQAAESVEIVDDTTVVIQLKAGLVYQDKEPVNGREVRTEDIAILHEYVRGEERAGEATFQRVFLDHMETPDDQTLVIHQHLPNGYLFSGNHLGGSANSIIPRELVEGDLSTMEPVGSGPYILDDYQFQVRYEYVRNPTWREADQGLPYIDRRVRIPLLDSAAIEAGFRGEQAQVMGGGDDRTSVPADMAERLIADLGDQIEVNEYVSLNPFTWNMSSARELFDDERVREAFYRNFDQDQMIDLVADGFAVRTTGKLPQGLEPYLLDESESEEYLRFDRDEARQLLDAAGFDFDETYIATTLTNPINVSAVEVFAEQLRQLGVQTRVETRPASEWIQEISYTGNYDFCGGVSHPPMDSPARLMRFHHTNTETHHQAFNMRDPEIDEMVEAAEQTVDREENIEAVKELQRELFRRYSNLCFVYTPILHELRWAYVRDWEFSHTGSVMYRTEAWLDT